MSEEALYAIIYSVIAIFVIYTIVLIIGFIQAYRIDKRNFDYFLEIKKIVEEIKQVIIKEEFVTMGKEIKNTLTLSDLVSNKASEEQYEEIMDMLQQLVQETYADYKFLIAKSKDEAKDPNFLQIVSNWHDNPELHKKIFSKSIDYGIDMKELQNKFANRIAEGKVLDLGEDVTVLTDDGTGQSPTGVSPINSGLEGGEIAFIISFIKTENYDEWYKNNFPEEEDVVE